MARLEDALSPEEVRSIRTLLRLTRRQLAAKLGMSEYSVRAWEVPLTWEISRRPNGAVCKLLRMWRNERLKNGKVNYRGTGS